MYKVRVLFDDFGEIIDVFPDFISAKEKFLFYINCSVEFNSNVRCINLMNGKGSIKMFKNH